MENIKVKDTYLVTQSNELIEARYSEALTRNEQKIILTMISLIQPQDEDFKEYSLTVKEYVALLGLDEDTEPYGYLKKLMKKLMSRVIEVPSKAHGGWKLAHWVSTCELVPKKGVLLFQFHPDLKPYLLQLQRAYTQYQLSNILTLTSSYSIRLYELLKQWERVGKVEFTLDDLRSKLGAIKKTFEKYYAFKTKILIRAIEEINEKTDIYVTYSEIKHGSKKVEGLSFIVKKRVIQQDNSPYLSDAHIKALSLKLRQQTKRYEITNDVLVKLMEKCIDIYSSVPDIEKRIEKELLTLVIYAEKNSTINNPVGFIISQLDDALRSKEDVDFSKQLNVRVETMPDYLLGNEESTVNKSAEEELHSLETNMNQVYALASELILKKLNGDSLTQAEEEFLIAAASK